MKLWVIKHTPTGHYIPRPFGRNGRGGSFLEPSEDSTLARLFYSERSAKIFLSAWLKGKHHCDRGYVPGHPGNDWEGEHFEEVSVVPVPSRKREEMEIIMKELDLG